MTQTARPRVRSRARFRVDGSGVSFSFSGYLAAISGFARRVPVRDVVRFLVMPLFSDWSLHSRLLTALAAMNIKESTPVQSEALPVLLAGRDAVLFSQTGSGKTLAYLLPALTRMLAAEPAPVPQPGRPATPFALILVPTQELAVQVRDVARGLFLDTERRVLALIGGANPTRQAEQLKKGVDLIVGTPSRVADFLSRGSLSLAQCHILVLDELDRLAEATHRADVVSLFHACRSDRWLIACSATPEQDAKNWVAALMRDPVVIELATNRTLPATLKHQVLVLDPREHLPTLRKLLFHLNPKGAIAFYNRASDIDWLVEKLRHHGVRVAGLHAGMGKIERTETMRAFRAGRLQLLVATELAARGLDLADVSLVLNLDFPHSADNYVHRVGRTARMGREGLAVSFVDPKFVRLLGVMERDLGLVFERPVYRFGEIRLPTPEDTRHEARRHKAQLSRAKERNAKPEDGAGGSQGEGTKKSSLKSDKVAPPSKVAVRQAAKGKARKAARKAKGTWKPARSKSSASTPDEAMTPGAPEPPSGRDG